jgi:hypothetical protein
MEVMQPGSATITPETDTTKLWSKFAKANAAITLQWSVHLKIHYFNV